MKNKIISIICIFSFLVMLFGCTETEYKVNIPEEILQEYVYELAKTTGFEGSFDEWVSGIKGTQGEDGRSIELSTSFTHIVWKYTDEVEWKPLIKIFDIKHHLLYQFFHFCIHILINHHNYH